MLRTVLVWLFAVVCIVIIYIFAGTAPSTHIIDQHAAISSVSYGAESLDPEVQKLIEAIKEVTRAAGEGQEVIFSSEQDELWRKENPCRARSQMKFMYTRRKYAKNLKPSPQWEMVFQEYGRMHRACMSKVVNLTSFFESKNTSTGCRFLIADVMSGAGLGNKVLVAVSYVLYAILTQRVLLVPETTLLPSIMCEPFPGSSWRIAEGTIPLTPHNHTDIWQLPNQFYREVDRVKQNRAASYASAVTYDSKRVFDQWHPRDRFFCSTEQSFYRNSTWLYVTGCVYTLPKLFAITSFRRSLESMFPDRMALSHLLRTVMLPKDAVWDRIRRLDTAYLAHADRRVGIQVRYKDGLPHYEKMNDVFNERITRCALNNNILPNVTAYSDTRSYDSEGPQTSTSTSNVATVFIACLFTGLHDHLTRFYLSGPSSTGESIGLVQVTHENRQDFGLEVDSQALTEVVLLSFSDELLVTPISTYGGMAQAYGSLQPWFVEIRKGIEEPCTLGQSVDICYQQGTTMYDCPYDDDVHSKQIAQVVPYIQKCLTTDFNPGVQLITV